jgi:hypothetical protein
MAGLKPELLQAVAIHLVLCCFLWSSKAEEENSRDHENIRMRCNLMLFFLFFSFC